MIKWEGHCHVNDFIADELPWMGKKNDKKRTIKIPNKKYKNTLNLFAALVRTPAAAALVLPRKQNPQIRRLHLHPCHQVSSDTEKRKMANKSKEFGCIP